jgi:hypothetical protein
MELLTPLAIDHMPSRTFRRNADLPISTQKKARGERA